MIDPTPFAPIVYGRSTAAPQLAQAQEIIFDSLLHFVHLPPKNFPVAFQKEPWHYSCWKPKG